MGSACSEVAKVPPAGPVDNGEKSRGKANNGSTPSTSSTTVAKLPPLPTALLTNPPPPPPPEPVAIAKLRKELAAKEQALEALRSEASKHSCLVVALEQETFQKDEALRVLSASEAAQKEATKLQAALRQKDELIDGLRRKAAGDEETLRALIVETRAKGDAVEDLVCAITEQAVEASKYRTKGAGIVLFEASKATKDADSKHETAQLYSPPLISSVVLAATTEEEASKPPFVLSSTLPPSPAPLGRSLQPYLATAKTELSVALAGSELVHIVMGNEAGDLDSVACSMVFAFLEAQRSLIRKGIGDHLSAGVMYFPVMNVPRSEMRLRKDNMMAFGVAGIEENSVICVDELPLEDLASKGRLALTLVDHNELSYRQGPLAGSVVRIVDHHRDAGLYKSSVAEDARFIAVPVGSCATLVAELALASGSVGDAVLSDRSCGLLIASTILMDTGNLEDMAKTTARDAAAIEALKTRSGEDREWGSRLNARLAKLRGDLTGCSTVEVLKKDLKYVHSGNESFAIASVVTSLWEQCSTVAAHNAFVEGFEDFLCSAELDSFYAIFRKGASAMTKTLIVCVRAHRWTVLGPSMTSKLAQGAEFAGVRFQAHKGEWFHKGECLVDGGHHEVHHAGLVLTVFEFDAASSRKQLLPFLEDFFCESSPAKQNAETEASAVLARDIVRMSLLGASAKLALQA